MNATNSSEKKKEKEGFRDATRQHHSFLTHGEKKVLVWIAKRLPNWVTPDQLTILGFIAMLGVGASYWWASHQVGGLALASVLLIINWFGDSLDGTLARTRNKLRPRYGFYVDHILDAMGTGVLVLGLGLSGYMNFSVAMGVLIAYYLLNIEVYLATYTLGNFQMSFMRFSPTELRILLIIGNTILPFRSTTRVFGPTLKILDIGAMVGIFIIFLVTIGTTIRHIRTLYQQEPYR